MACNSCKKKKEKIIPAQIELDDFQLRDGISYDQIGLDNPTQERIVMFLMTNPKRISLFSKYPENWMNNERLTDDE